MSSTSKYAGHVDARFYTTIAVCAGPQPVEQRTLVRCGGCSGYFVGRRGWASHWIEAHGSRGELEVELTAIQRGEPRMKRGIFGGDRRLAGREYYRRNAKRHSRYVGNWYRAHPEVARRMEKRKWSRAIGAREARALRKWWREHWPSCSSCGRRIEIRERLSGATSFCPEHGTAWTWSDAELWPVVASGHEKAVATMRATGMITQRALKAWATRRARGHVAEDVRRLWRTRKARYGPSGMTRSRTGRILSEVPRPAPREVPA